MQIERLADTGEEAVILTASIVDNACTQFGSSKGEGFLGKQSNLSSKFLSFCSGMFSFFPYFSLYAFPPLSLFLSLTWTWDLHLRYHAIFALSKVHFQPESTGPSCSKLTMSLVNDLLKFTSGDMQIC